MKWRAVLSSVEMMTLDVWHLIRDGARRWLLRRRVPVLQQLTAVECGAACLAMILSYYGRRTSVGECRESCFPGRDGLTGRTIATAAREFGLIVKAFATDMPDLAKFSLPAIAHWGFNHFVVLERWSRAGAVIVDPATGRKRVGAEEFSRKFTGVLLILEPGPTFVRRRRTGGTKLATLLHQMLDAPAVSGMIAQILLASLLLQASGLVLPILTKVLVDEILPFRVRDALVTIGVGAGLVVLGRLVTGYLRSLLMVSLRAQLDAVMMHGFMEHLFALPYGFFQHRNTGDLLMRLSSNSMLRDLMTNQTVSLILDGLFALTYLAILFGVAPSLGLVTVAIAVMQLLVLAVTRVPMNDVSQRDLASKADEQSYLTEALRGILLVKASGSEGAVLDQWSSLFHRQLNVSIQRSTLSTHVETLLGTLRSFAPLFILWVGAYDVMSDRMTVGTMLAGSAIAAAFLFPLANIVSAGQQLQVLRAYVERLTDVLDEPEEQTLPASAGERAARLQGRVDVRELSFRYDPHGELVLDNVSLSIAPGEKLAIVGPTGSGKSTLAQLCLGLYRPSGGTILHDGQPLDAYELRDLRRQIGIVLQEPTLFSGTILQNLTLGQPGVPWELVVEAATLAEIHKDVCAMPLGYETVVAEGGWSLSGGQRQRLALARALIRKPAVLILDEATSHLDARTELKVHRNLCRLACTRIVIAHRLSTVRDADRIVVLNGGHVVQQGTHAALREAGGLYAALMQSQETRDVGVVVGADA